MILCSCNYVTDKMIQDFMKNHKGKLPSAQIILQSLGKESICATCAQNIKCEIRKHKKGE